MGQARPRQQTILTSYLPPVGVLGPMTLAGCVGLGAGAGESGGALVGAWFDGQAHDRAGLAGDATVLAPDEAFRRAPVLAQATAWLDRYLAGQEPPARPALAPAGTPFQHLVWQLLDEVPSGGTTTYGDLARQVALRRGRPTSPRAVGAAVGRNPLSVIVPCHRVLGADGSLTGYAGGTERKRWLLTHEGCVLP